LLGCCVEILAELHNVHAALTQRRTDRRRRIRLACRNFEFDVTFNFLCHRYPSACVPNTLRCAGSAVRLPWTFGLRPPAEFKCARLTAAAVVSVPPRLLGGG